MRSLLLLVAFSSCVKSVPSPLGPCTELAARPEALPAAELTTWGQTGRWQPSLAFRPNCHPDSLALLLEWVDHTRPWSTRVKAGGSRHSFNGTAATSDVYIHTEGLRFLEPFTPDLASSAQLMLVGGGTKLRELNDRLWQWGKALPLLGGYDGQSLAGALSTGTHGSVLAQGALADALIRSVNLVTGRGQKVRIEPTHGVTSRETFASTHPDTELLQDDELFAAVKVNLGTFGVVHSYVIEVVDRFYLDEVRSLTTLDRMKTALTSLQAEPVHHLEFLWNVHTGTVLATTRQPIAERELAALPPEHRQRPNALVEHLGRPIAAVNEVLERLVPQAIPSLVDAALRSLPDEHYIDRSDRVYTVGDGLNAMPFLLGTFSVPLEHGAALQAVGIIKQVADSLAATGHFQPGPVALRFKKGLSPPQGSLLSSAQDSCEFEFIFSGTDARSRAEAWRLMTAYDTALHAQLGPAVRLHFGQLYPTQAATFWRTNEAYPGLGAFNRWRRQLDPDDRFLNAFQRRLLTPN